LTYGTGNNMIINSSRDVDCVITTIEIEEMLDKQGECWSLVLRKFLLVSDFKNVSVFHYPRYFLYSILFVILGVCLASSERRLLDSVLDTESPRLLVASPGEEWTEIAEVKYRILKYLTGWLFYICRQLDDLLTWSCVFLQIDRYRTCTLYINHIGTVPGTPSPFLHKTIFFSESFLET
jgi:hypothetical protein